MTIVGALALSVAVSAQAYRTGADLSEFKGTERVRWEHPKIRYRLFDSVPGNLRFADVERATREAFARWGEPECSQVMFSYQGSTLARAAAGDSVNTIQFIYDDWAERGFDSTAGGVTDVQYERRGDEWVIVEADLYINADTYTWVLGEPTMSGQRDLRSVFVHEGGHMLGLLHPCELSGDENAPLCTAKASYSETAMFPFYSQGALGLASDDEAGVCFLYPGQSCEIAGCPVGSECTDSGCRVVCEDTVCQQDEVCIARTCALPDQWCDLVDCGRCEETIDCASDLVCRDGQCGPGHGPAGDPCSSGRDCESTVCDDGHCAQACLRDGDCGQDPCVDFICRGKRKPLGTSCTESNECVGDECLAGDSEEPLCTRRCDFGFQDCPAGWYCGRVEDRSVCRPDQHVAACGCSVPGERRLSGLPWGITLAALGCAVTVRSARTRRGGRRADNGVLK